MIKPYQGEIDIIKLNQWLQQLEVYFNGHNIGGEQTIPFSQLKLEGVKFKQLQDTIFPTISCILL